MTRPLCIAHGSNCVDGHAASWVVRRALPDAEIVYASYNRPPPNNIAGRDVVIVDFSYPRTVLDEAIAQSARSVLVLDHHKSAAEDLREVPQPMPSTWDDWLLTGANDGDSLGARGTGNLAAIFDMSRSGAGLTWDYFNPGIPRPWFIDLVEDRDLWKFTDPRSRPFHAAVTSYPFSFKMWERLMAEEEADWTLGIGNQAFRQDLDAQQIIATTRRTMVIGGVRVPVCNCPPWLASDVGHELCNPRFEVDHDVVQIVRDGQALVAPRFSATYYDRDGKRNFSLRSHPDGDDVSQVCALYGGGGHRNAGGFEAPQGWEGE